MNVKKRSKLKGTKNSARFNLRSQRLGGRRESLKGNVGCWNLDRAIQRSTNSKSQTERHFRPSSRKALSLLTQWQFHWQCDRSVGQGAIANGTAIELTGSMLYA